MTRQTKSEELFQKYCTIRGYRVERLNTSANRTLDFLVHTSQGEVVAEVTELRANDEDAKFAKQQEIAWRACNRLKVKPCAFGTTIGKRLREKIEDKLHQTKPLASRCLPCVIVVYDNIRYHGRRVHLPWAPDLYPDHFSIAMYGEYVVVMTLSEQSGKILRTRDAVGGNRKLRPDQGTHVSAVCHLAESPETGEPFFITYHNGFSTTKLATSVFAQAADVHLKNPETDDGFQVIWERIQSATSV